MTDRVTNPAIRHPALQRSLGEHYILVYLDANTWRDRRRNASALERLGNPQKRFGITVFVLLDREGNVVSTQETFAAPADSEAAVRLSRFLFGKDGYQAVGNAIMAGRLPAPVRSLRQMPTVLRHIVADVSIIRKRAELDYSCYGGPALALLTFLIIQIQKNSISRPGRKRPGLFVSKRHSGDRNRRLPSAGRFLRPCDH